MRIIVATEKHGARYHDATDDVEPAAKKIIEERLADGYWYGPADTEKARKAIASETCWQFLVSRSRYEYEHVELSEVETN